MNDNGSWEFVKFILTLLFGAGGATVIGKFITGGNEKLVDSATVRSELWKELKEVKDDLDDLRGKYQHEHDEHIRLESFIAAFVSAYSDVRHKGLQMAKSFRENDASWKVWAAQLEATPDAESLFDRVIKMPPKDSPPGSGRVD